MDDLIKAISNLHNCKATYTESVDVKEVFEGKTAWDGTIHVFEVDHPNSDTCYAWSSSIEGSSKRKYYAVLKIPPVDSPVAAVRASIVSDFRSSNNET
jgi:hypothetical protein